MYCKNLNAGASIVKGQHIVNLGLPVWIDGSQSECEDYKEMLTKIFQELSRSDAKSVVISLKPLERWTFDHLMSSTVDFAAKWLLAGHNKRPNTVRLCPGKEGFAATDACIDKCFERLISGMKSSTYFTLNCSAHIGESL